MAGEPILIVEDNDANLKLAVYLLSRHGYDVRTAKSAETALAILRDFHPRLVLTDVQLPGMDGLELTRHVKADPFTRSTVVVAVTAYATRGDEVAARAAGCDGFISKPIDTRAFPLLVALHLTPTASAPIPNEKTPLVVLAYDPLD